MMMLWYFLGALSATILCLSLLRLCEHELQKTLSEWAENAQDWSNRQKSIRKKTVRADPEVAQRFVVVFPMVNRQIALAVKPVSHGRLGEGLYNGYGGKVMAGESLEAAARRELLEESGFVAGDLFHLATMLYTTEGNTISVDTFLCTFAEYTGVSDGEMVPKGLWAPEDLPFDAMWPDNSLWMPSALATGHFVTGAVKYVPDSSHPSGVSVESYSYSVSIEQERAALFRAFCATSVVEDE